MTGHRLALAALALAALPLGGCARSTGALAPEMARRLEAEGVLRRADDLRFRATAGAGRRRWEDGRASIVVTRSTVLIHRNERTLVEIIAPADGAEVHRDHDRISLRTAGGRSAQSWSFRPPDDADGWTRDIRAVIRGATTP